MSRLQQRVSKLEKQYRPSQPGLSDVVRIMAEASHPHDEEKAAAEKAAALACIDGNPSPAQVALWEAWKQRVWERIELEFPEWG